MPKNDTGEVKMRIGYTVSSNGETTTVVLDAEYAPDEAECLVRRANTIEEQQIRGRPSSTRWFTVQEKDPHA
jgi:hypothetical protein